MQTEMKIGMIPPSLNEIGFRQGSQNYRVYAELLFYYSSMDPELSWTPTQHISGIAPGGVTRRIHDVRVALQPDKALRGRVGWWVENKVKSVHDPILDRKVKHSWYRLIYLGEETGLTLQKDELV